MKTQCKNSNLERMNSDYLYHLGINIANTRDTSNIQKQFGDVKIICMGGTKHRMEALAKYLRQITGIDADNKDLVDLCESAQRYAVYKVGPILCCSHGIGMSSMSILVHELIKLVTYAQCNDPIFIRVGTCGGLGVPGGTVVVSKDAYNGYLRNEHEIAILGERVARPAKFNEEILKSLLECSDKNDGFLTVGGNTMAAECFYEGQGRLDGASCNYSVDDKMKFLQKCHAERGILNIEMEATMFSSLTLHMGIKAADICVTLLNRLDGDQVELTHEQKHKFEQRPFTILGRFIMKRLAIAQEANGKD